MTEEIKQTEEVKPKAKARPKKKEVVENDFFKAKELRCKHTGKDGFDPEFLELLTKIRIECDFPFPITSAFRDATHPAEQGKKKGVVGSHQLGKAVDILCRGEKALKLIEVAQKHGIKRIGVQQRGLSRFIHIDSCTEADGKPPAIWSY